MKRLKQIVSSIILVAFGVTSILPPARASQMPWMPTPGAMVPLSPVFAPPLLKGIVIHPEDPMQFDFIVHKGDVPLNRKEKEIAYKQLIKYFLASLAVPDEHQWVNLSPYEKNRIIEKDFGITEMGRDLLAQDYLLKQITASLMYPEGDIGKAFWEKIYKQAYKEYGVKDIPVDTFNKVWIVPGKATIYEKGNTAYVLKNHLRVMLEEDYMALQQNSLTDVKSKIAAGNPKMSVEAAKVLREVIIPALEQEVNEGKNFAPLRQVYSGMLLAAWYKRVLKESFLSKIYADKSKLKGVNQDDPKKNQEIYDQYVQAFKKGVYNLIKEEYDPSTQSVIPKKYFSGGMGSFVREENGVLKDDFAMLVDTVKEEELTDNDIAAIRAILLSIEMVPTELLTKEKKGTALPVVPTVAPVVSAQEISAQIGQLRAEINSLPFKFRDSEAIPRALAALDRLEKSQIKPIEKQVLLKEIKVMIR
ncbi:MAG: hypothetical protein HQL24_04890, partial [Candidatus Omnitrophica bacterium]|nr:hypothetical protein [Candidatus Omnitrophota bacterium]